MKTFGINKKSDTFAAHSTQGANKQNIR